MCALKTKSDILQLESSINHIWGELNTSTIAHSARLEFESKLSECEKKFKTILSGQGSSKELEKELSIIDKDLALAAVTQAENEIPRAEHTKSAFQALENIRKELLEGKLSPLKVRHEVKDIMRSHS